MERRIEIFFPEIFFRNISESFSVCGSIIIEEIGLIDYRLGCAYRDCLVKVIQEIFEIQSWFLKTQLLAGKNSAKLTKMDY